MSVLQYVANVFIVKGPQWSTCLLTLFKNSWSSLWMYTLIIVVHCVLLGDVYITTHLPTYLHTCMHAHMFCLLNRKCKILASYFKGWISLNFDVHVGIWSSVKHKVGLFALVGDAGVDVVVGSQVRLVLLYTWMGCFTSDGYLQRERTEGEILGQMSGHRGGVI